jgi:hypothetical protein
MRNSIDNTRDVASTGDGLDPRVVDLSQLGCGEVAYVKPVRLEGENAFAVHGADGRPLAVVADRDVAFSVVRQNDLEPLSVH